MSNIAENLLVVKSILPKEVTLIVVTKTHPVERLLEVYACGHKVFGENKVQEMLDKYERLPKDIEWHMIGHLQTNKVKFIAPFVSLIQSVDSFKLLNEINKEAKKYNRIINCLLQIYIASEETKFGMSFSEAKELLTSEEFKLLTNIKIVGLMGMASNIEDQVHVANEFKSLKNFFDSLSGISAFNMAPLILSMGMSSDYLIAIANGSNMIRVGSTIFGNRK